MLSIGHIAERVYVNHVRPTREAQSGLLAVMLDDIADCMRDHEVPRQTIDLAFAMFNSRDAQVPREAA
jgi:hypothetical protein